MLNGLITILVTGTVAASGMGMYNQNCTEEVKEVKVEAVESLESADKDYLLSLEGKSMRDLTLEEKEKLREINSKIHDYMYDNIDDEELKAEMKLKSSVSTHFRAIRQMSEEEKNEYISTLTEDEQTLLQERLENHKGNRQYRNR